MAKRSNADILLEQTYAALDLAEESSSAKYASILDVVGYLARENERSTVDVVTTGTISERLCVLGLEQIKETIPSFDYRRFDRNWKWIGDLLISGDPYDIAISVKSYKAKERLLASGTGSLLTPTIGWGLFNDPSEWSADRTVSYLYRGFVAIYMPEPTYVQVSDDARQITNINGRPLLRDLSTFPDDIQSAIPHRKNRVDCRML